MSSSSIGSTGLAGRYASALYELADDAGKLDQVADDLKSLSAMMEESDDLNRLITSPVLTRAEQIGAMTAICSKAKFDDLSVQFVGTVAGNRRLLALGTMIKAYLDELSHRRGEATAEVVSAEKLTTGQLKAITDALKKAVGTKVSVDAQVDKSLLGGLIVKVGSRMVDSSLKTKLQQLRLSMKGVG